jgi:hypothetical protein
MNSATLIAISARAGSTALNSEGPTAPPALLNHRATPGLDLRMLPRDFAQVSHAQFWGGMSRMFSARRNCVAQEREGASLCKPIATA